MGRHRARRSSGFRSDVRIKPQVQVESFFDVRDRAGDDEKRGIGKGFGDGEVVRVGEINDCLVIRRTGGKAFDELLRREIAVIIGARRVVDIVYELGEFRLVAVGQADLQLELIGLGQATDGRSLRGGRGNVSMEDLGRRRPDGQRGQQTERGSDQRQLAKNAASYVTN